MKLLVVIAILLVTLPVLAVEPEPTQLLGWSDAHPNNETSQDDFGLRYIDNTKQHNGAPEGAEPKG